MTDVTESMGEPLHEVNLTTGEPSTTVKEQPSTGVPEPMMKAETVAFGVVCVVGVVGAVGLYHAFGVVGAVGAVGAAGAATTAGGAGVAGAAGALQ